MSQFFAAIAPYLSNPLFQVTFSGVTASIIHSFLKNHGLSFTKGQTFAFNSVFSVVPLIVLASQWGTKGVPGPDMFFLEVLGCIGASQLLYKSLQAREADGSIDTIQVPVFSQTDVPSTDPAQAPVAVLNVPASVATVSAPDSAAVATPAPDAPAPASDI